MKIMMGHFGTKSHSKFQFLFGITIEDAVRVFHDLGNNTISLFDLLMALHFMRHYPKVQEGALQWRITEYTYRTAVWNTVGLLANLKRVAMKFRFEQPPPTKMFQCMLTVVDASEFEVLAPQDWMEQKRFYSNKKKLHGVKYQFIVRANDGYILDCSDMYPVSVHDVKLWYDWLATNESILLSSEVVGADKGYVGGRRCYTPYKATANKPLTADQKSFNFAFGQVRCVVEQAIQRMKIFQALKEIWRHDFSLHPLVVKAVANIVNYTLTTAPIRTENKFLTK